MTLIVLLWACAEEEPPAQVSAPAPVLAEERAYGGAASADMAAKDAPPPMSPGAAADGNEAGVRMRAVGLMAGGRQSPADAAPTADVAPTRAWFPESFLWTPLVEVPASGTATVEFTVPDTLTTWRVLALGQTRGGAQAGAVTELRSTLDTSVDVRVPAFLRVGDSVRLPVRVERNRPEALAAALDVRIEGGEGGGRADIAVSGGGAVVRPVDLVASRAGTVTVRASLGATDAVARTIPVRRAGRAVETTRGGTLAAPRELSFDAVDGAPLGAELDLRVFPGVRGVIDAELDAARGGGSLAAVAYAYALAAAAEAAVPADDPAVAATRAERARAARLRAWQGLSRATRTGFVDGACDAVIGMGAPPDDRPEAALATRLRAQARAAQQPDGHWTVPPGSTIDRQLAHTGRCAWALGDGDAKREHARASSAFARGRTRVEASPALTAVALAAGLIPPDAKARDRVRAALVALPDGARALPADPDAGISAAAANAWAALALPPDDPAAADAITALLGAWTPDAGFGAPEDALLALRALEHAFGKDPPAKVSITLEIDGRAVTTGSFDAARPWTPLRLQADAPLAASTVRVVASPAVPALAYTLSRRAWLPYEVEAPRGLDIEVRGPDRARVGIPSPLRVRAAGPPDEVVTIRVGLPAGAVVDAAALDALRGDELARALDGVMGQSPNILSWSATEGELRVEVRLAGGAWSADLPVTPTFAGRFSVDPPSIRAVDGAYTGAAATWTVSP